MASHRRRSENPALSLIRGVRQHQTDLYRHRTTSLLQHAIIGQRFVVTREDNQRVVIKKHWFDNVFKGVVPDEGSTSRSVTVHAFETECRGQLFRDFQKCDCQKYEVGTLEGRSMIVSDQVGFSLRKWMEIEKQNSWEYNSNYTECMGLGPDLKDVLKSILLGVQKIHNSGMYHGNLKDAVRVTENSEVFIIASPLNDDDLATGIEKDLLDFKNLVTAVLRKHPIAHGLDVPRDLMLFFELYNIGENTAFHRLSEYAFYIYNDPVFYNWMERFVFLEKAVHLKNRNIAFFKNKLTFSQHPVDMTDWINRIPVHQDDALYKVLYDKPELISRSYSFANGFLDFQRNVVHHFQRHCPHTSEQQIEERLHDLFPESCAVIYFAIVEKFAFLDEMYDMFGGTLQEILMEEPTPCT